MNTVVPYPALAPLTQKKSLVASALEFSPSDGNPSLADEKPIKRNSSWDSLEQSMNILRSCSNPSLFGPETPLDEDLQMWLRNTNLQAFSEAFIESGFDSLTTVKLLREADLLEMNIPAKEHSRIMTAVRALNMDVGDAPSFRRAITFPLPAEPASASQPIHTHSHHATNSDDTFPCLSSAEFFQSSAPKPVLCRFFLNGFCSRGSTCYFLHTTPAKRMFSDAISSAQAKQNQSTGYGGSISTPSSPSGTSSGGNPHVADAFSAEAIASASSAHPHSHQRPDMHRKGRSMTAAAAATAHKIAVQQKPRMKWVQKARNNSETNGSYAASESSLPPSPSNAASRSHAWPSG